MNSKILIIFAFLSASVLFCFETIQAQKLVSGGKPKKITRKEFDEAYCVNLPNSFLVCKVFDESEWKSDFIIQKEEEVLHKFDAASYAGVYGDDFWAYYGDLDKSGSPEIIISALENISNGMGVKHFNVFVFSDPTKFGFKQSLAFPIQDFGEKGNFIFDSTKNETQILVTYWSWFDNLDPKRGYGTYLVGKWFRFRKGLLEPVFENPTLARRLLYSFVDEKNKIDKNPFAPYRWLKSKNTHSFFAEPDDLSNFLDKQTGIIESYQQDTSDSERYISIKLDSGKILEAQLSYSVYGYGENDFKIPITDLGLWKNKFVIPFWFNPKFVFNDFEGKKVRLEIYQDQYNNKYGKLWLLEN